MDELDIFAAELKPPEKRFVAVSDSRQKPSAVSQPGVQVSSKIAAARTDAELSALLAENRSETVVVNFGSTWCHSCHAMFPHFYQLTSKFPHFKYVMAQIDYMHESAEGVKYTPTFRIVQRGKIVDQFYGASKEALRDHLWLHSD